MRKIKKAKRKSIKDFIGIWKEDADEWKKIEKKIYEDRKKAKLRDIYGILKGKAGEELEKSIIEGRKTHRILHNKRETNTKRA